MVLECAVLEHGNSCGRGHYDAVLDQMRRLADLLIAGAILILALPLMVLVVLATRWGGRGAIFERQTCFARGCRRFQMLNFRTTVPDPEHSMPVWARKPTQLGEFPRYTRIECLPQLINVLRGDISLLDHVEGSTSFLD
jgi:lipopolysaccharide/colanic/teichoic acid biosynthesis glycosyltransferase